MTTQHKTIIHTSQVPMPGNSTSQAVGYGGLFFLSGQVALDPYHHGILDEGGVREQMRRVLENTRMLLLASGLDLAHVLRVTLYVKNMGDLHKIDEVYAEFFDLHPPARTVVEVSRLPQDALVCLDLVAAAPSASSSATKEHDEDAHATPHVQIIETSAAAHADVTDDLPKTDDADELPAS